MRNDSRKSALRDPEITGLSCRMDISHVALRHTVPLLRGRSTLPRVCTCGEVHIAARILCPPCTMRMNGARLKTSTEMSHAPLCATNHNEEWRTITDIPMCTHDGQDKNKKLHQRTPLFGTEQKTLPRPLGVFATFGPFLPRVCPNNPPKKQTPQCKHDQKGLLGIPEGLADMFSSHC